MNRHQSPQWNKSIIGSLFKITILWLILSYVVVMAANAAEVSAGPLTYFVMAGFAIHCLMAVLFSVSEPGSAWKIPLGITVAAAGFFGLHATPTRDINELRNSAGQAVAWMEGKNRSFQNMKALDHLAAAANLMFEKEDRSSLAQARRHLLAIPNGSSEYASAQALLRVTDANSREAIPIEILQRDQKDDRIVVTLRNNGPKPVRNIEYRVSYFEIPTGMHLKSGTPLKIKDVIGPRETSIIEIPRDILKAPAHAAFALLNWETAGS